MLPHLARSTLALKLRPGGLKAIRSPEFLGGLPSNTPEMQSRVLSSRALLHRCVQLLECAFEGGGHCDLEQPTNAMSWMEDFVQAFLLRVHAHCISTPACRWGLDLAKSWLFASSSSLLHTLAGKCTHPANSHSSIAGVLDSFGCFASQQTAIYPAALCQAYARLMLLPIPAFWLLCALTRLLCLLRRLRVAFVLRPSTVLPRPRKMAVASRASLIGAFLLWVYRTA